MSDSYSLIKPCAICPFRRNMVDRFRFHPERVRKIVECDGNGFMCHNTGEYDNDGEPVSGSAIQCAGFLVLREHEGTPTQMMRIMERLGLYDRTSLDMTADTFESGDAMINAYEALYAEQK